MNTLRTENLTLEPQVAAHADEMFEVLRDPAIYEFEGRPPASVEWLRDRFAKLESRRSPDGEALWLNWVIRLTRSSALIGYVQATVLPGSALIAYELSSAFWGRGLASEAVRAMIAELVAGYRVVGLSAVLRRENVRSLRLLERLGFSLASAEEHASADAEPGELLMRRDVPGARGGPGP